MPRNYKRKTQSKYSNDDLLKALNAIKHEHVSPIDAAKRFGIPSSTIYNRLSGRYTNARRGARGILSKEEESFLVHVIQNFQDWQHPMTPASIKLIAKNYMIELGRTFSVNSPLTEWFHGFMNRWKNEIRLVKDVKLEKKRSEACTELVVEKWFSHLKDVLDKNSLFNRPEAIWNVDESGFTDDPGRKQVIVRRSTKHAISSHSGSGKSHTTVLICTSASGECLPPYIIHQGVRLYDTWCPRNGFPGTRYNVSSSGWVDETVFYDWLTRHFAPVVESIRKPVLLIFDGHYTHISTRIIKFAMMNGIQIECLPPHSTTILQPLDVVTLTKVKTAWRKLLREHNFKTNSTPIDKVQFAYLIKELWKNNLLKSHCQGGFAKAGIYPFDPRAVTKEKLLTPPSSAGGNSNQELFPSIRNDSSSTAIRSDESTATGCTIRRSSSCINLSASCESLDKNVSRSSCRIFVALDLTSTTLDVTTDSNVTNNNVARHKTKECQSSLPVTDIDSSTTTAASIDPTTTAMNNSNNSTNINSTVHSLPGNALDALTRVINNHMTSPQKPTNKRKRSVERPYGESLTSMDVLIKLSQKDKNKRQRATKTAPNQTTKGRKNKNTAAKGVTNANNGNINNANVPQEQRNDFSTVVSSTSNAQTSTATFHVDQYPSGYSNANNNNIDYFNNMSYYQSCYRCSSSIPLGTSNCASCISCLRICCRQCIPSSFVPNQMHFTCELCYLQGAITYTDL